jgi:methionine sulfoxide reductase heme-binding subunit
MLLSVFAYLHTQWSPMHRWNRSFGDVSLVLVALAMAIGPLARLWRPAARAIPYRRELGIWGTLAALVHTVIILAGWVEWDLLRLFGFEFHPALRRYVMVQHGFALANVVGILALLLAAILALTSNDYALRRLGTSSWKFLQMGAVPLWWLIVLHVGYFLFVHFMDFHRQTPDPNPLQWPFVGLVAAVLGFRAVAYIATVRVQVGRRPGRVRAET